MNRLGFGFLIVGSLLLLSCDRAQRLETAEGQFLKVSVTDNRYIAVNYWAGWCTSCKEEVHSMNKLSQQLGSQLLILGVNFDRKKGSALLSAIHKLNIRYPVIVSNIGGWWHLPEPEILPTTYLLSPNHQVLKVFYGKKTADQLKHWLTHV